MLFQQESVSDGESISGSALICQALIKLHMLTEKKHYLTHAEDTLQLSQSRWHTHKFSSMGSLIAAQTYFSRNHKKILISLAHEEDRRIILSYFSGLFAPYVSLVWMKQGERELLERLLPEHEHVLIPKEGQSSSIICVIEPGMGRKFSNIEDFCLYLKEQTL
ncbi:hypothetical protein M832_01210 [Chlamydia avium 10DC88]|uniref:Uncharacterized protein n=1 Tax=Chlamydia avium 10DC88 TaxID=1229831 RepID=W8JFL2_9CHLA|nr:hypothetical protein M832_01210 [Chlamydia avium 10DC88]